MEDVLNRKRALRKEIRGLIKSWSTAEKKASDDGLFATFLDTEALSSAQTILLFYGVGIEPETARLLPKLRRMGKRVLLPRCLPGWRMEAREVWEDCPMKQMKLGIPEPTEACPLVEQEDIDLILVPALCYDRQGYRLGQGGGYYDRYLARYRGNTLGLCREALLQENLPREAHDLPVAFVVTERELLVP